MSADATPEATPVVFFVESLRKFVFFTDTPFARPGYPGFEIEDGGDPGFRLLIGTGEMTPVDVDYVVTPESIEGPFSIDGVAGESIVIYPPATAERHPYLHGRLRGARMRRLEPEEYNYTEADGQVTITLK